MRERARVQLIGEVTGVGRSKVQAYFELRDGQGAVPCAIWLNDLEKAGLPEGALRDGAELVIAGGPDYYPGGGQASPSFSFRATHVRLAGEGDLLARLRGAAQAAARRGPLRAAEAAGAAAAAEERSAWSRRSPAPPGATCWPGLRRRGWGGTVVWAFAPVQDRHAAPAIAAAIQGLAARPEVEAIVVTRGGGSLADLWAFCDETLCRTVAMLRVPVVSAIGHERDSTLIDDVAAVACSTPTHAAEAAVPLDCGVARRELAALRLLAAAGGGGGDRGAGPPPGGAGARPGAGAAARAQRPQPEDPRDPRLLRTRPRRARAASSGGSPRSCSTARGGGGSSAPPRPRAVERRRGARDRPRRRPGPGAPPRGAAQSRCDPARARSRAHPGARLRAGRDARRASRSARRTPLSPPRT